MYSVFAFLITATQLGIILGSFMLHSSNIVMTALVYGSPLYLAKNMFNPASILLGDPIYPMLFCYHVFKYFIMCRAHIVDHRNLWRNLSILLEAAYLGLSAHYLT